MGADEVATGVRALLEDHIESYEQLRVLLLLRETNGGPHTAKAVSACLGLSLDETDDALAALTRRGLVQTHLDEQRTARFGYGELASARRKDIEDLAAACKDQVLEVMRLMSRNAAERVRMRALQAFPDVFATQRRRG